VLSLQAVTPIRLTNLHESFGTAGVRVIRLLSRALLSCCRAPCGLSVDSPLHSDRAAPLVLVCRVCCVGPQADE